MIHVSSFAQTDIFIWNFEDQNLVVDVDNAIGTPIMTEGVLLTSQQYFTGMNANCNGTTTGTFARSGASWDAGDYYQFQVDATGYTNMSFSCCLRISSITTPGTWRVRASSDGGASWTTIVNDFTFTALLQGVNGVLPASFDNQTNVIIQVYNVTTGVATNALRIDNVKLIGFSCSGPNEVTGAAGTPALGSANISWTNPGGCSDERMVVAAPAANSGTPSGDGTAYTADAAYPNGTALGNGYVVYKGTGANVTVTGLTNGTPYYFKIFSRLGTTWSAGVEVTVTPADATQTTDYFRSVATGLWSANSTWESSHDNITWITATATPTNLANTITIRNHTVTVNTPVTFDQVVIENGGTLENALTTGALTFGDGAGDDVIVQNGGTYWINNTQNSGASQTFVAGTSLRFETGGRMLVGSGGTVGTGHFGIPTNTANTWQHGSVFEWNSTSNIPFQGVYFPNAAAGTTPVLKVSAPVAGFGGSGTVAFTLNGLLDANAIVHVGGATTKFFRDGINNTDSLVFGANVGKVTLGNGTTTTVLSGAGAIAVPVGGFDIAAGTNITLPNSKTFYTPNPGSTGIGLTTGFITLGNFNLNVVGTAGRINGSSTGYVITNGTGKLTMDSIGVGGTTTPVVFPVGPSAALYHPATITNTTTAIDSFSVNVSSTVAACVLATHSVNATWDITENTDGVSDCTLSLDYTGATTGASYTAGTASIAHCAGTTADYTNGSVTGTVATGLGFTNFSPFVISSPIIVPLRLLSFTGTKSGSEALLTWTTADELNVKGFEVQRSADAVTYNTIGFVKAGQSDYSFTDRMPVKGNNFYRLRIVDIDGKTGLSKVAPLHFAAAAGDIKVYPTLVSDRLFVVRSSNEMVNYRVFNSYGQQVLAGQLGNAKEISVSAIPSGNYILKVGDYTVKFSKQ